MPARRSLFQIQLVPHPRPATIQVRLGLGEATALKFAEEGAKVVIAARRAAQSEGVVQRIAGAGGEALFVQADVSRAADVEARVKAAVQRFGRLDCAVNAASQATSGTRCTAPASSAWSF